jgi:hypothetical protein
MGWGDGNKGWESCGFYGFLGMVVLGHFDVVILLCEWGYYW